MSNLILPNHEIEVTKPVIFLAGPIRSAPEWQEEAIKYLLTNFKNLDFNIASPTRETKIGGEYLLPGEKKFLRQRAWERHYLNLAADNGAILFWLPGEATHDCNKVYGAITRMELGQWMTNYRHDPSKKVCFGTDGKFPEMRTIEYDLELDCPDKKIFGTLEETCNEAIRLAFEDRK
jgi:hypothetical protein